MPVFGITGGIGTGKTALTQALQRVLPAEIFDADACARDLVSNDAAVRRAIRQRFGGAIFTPAGHLQRDHLRDIVFADIEQRRALEAILHSPIRQRWLKLAQNAVEQTRWLYVDIPLLFETDARRYFDSVIVVACSAATQRKRLAKIRKLPHAIAEKIIAAQIPLSEKITQADHVIWNDGDHAALEQQALLLSNYLKLRYG